MSITLQAAFLALGSFLAIVLALWLIAQTSEGEPITFWDNVSIFLFFGGIIGVIGAPILGLTQTWKYAGFAMSMLVSILGMYILARAIFVVPEQRFKDMLLGAILSFAILVFLAIANHVWA